MLVVFGGLFTIPLFVLPVRLTAHALCVCVSFPHPVAQDMLVSQGRTNIRISRIVENAETPLFKSKFYRWDPPASFDVTAPRSSGIAGVCARWCWCWCCVWPLLAGVVVC